MRSSEAVMGEGLQRKMVCRHTHITSPAVAKAMAWFLYLFVFPYTLPLPTWSAVALAKVEEPFFVKTKLITGAVGRSRILMNYPG